jgi:AraC-like DNA-binding protein
MDGAGLAEAAAAAGYADQAHFTRQLRRWFGVSPARGLASFRIRAAR